MQREQAKELFPIIRDEKEFDRIVNKIEDIEKEGYIFQSTDTEKIRTLLSPYGFDPRGFDKMSGEELTVATFQNEAGNKRYCIVNSEGELINKSFSALRNQAKYYDSQYDFTETAEKTNQMRECLEQEGIYLTNNQIYAAIDIPATRTVKNIGEEIPEFMKSDAYLVEIAADIKEDVEFFLEDMPEIQARTSAPMPEIRHPGRKPRDFFEFKHELSFCGEDRQARAIHMIASHIQNGANPTEQEFITNTVVEIMKQVGAEMIQNGQFFNVQVTEVADLYQEAVSDMQKRFKDMDQESKENMVSNYLTTYQGKENEHGSIIMVPQIPHPSIVKGVVEAIDHANESGTILQGNRINNDLKRIGWNISKTAKAFQMNPSDIREATKNIVKNYVSHKLDASGIYNPEENFAEAFDKITDITIYKDYHRLYGTVRFPQSDSYLKEVAAFLEESAGIPETERMSEKQMEKCLHDHFKDMIGQMDFWSRSEIAMQMQYDSNIDKHGSIASVLYEDPEPDIRKMIADSESAWNKYTLKNGSELPDDTHFNVYFKDIIESEGISTNSYAIDDPEIKPQETDDVSL